MPKHVKVSGTYQAHQIAFLYLVALGRLACEPAHLSAIFFFFLGGGGVGWREDCRASYNNGGMGRVGSLVPRSRAKLDSRRK